MAKVKLTAWTTLKTWVLHFLKVTLEWLKDQMLIGSYICLLIEDLTNYVKSKLFVAKKKKPLTVFVSTHDRPIRLPDDYPIPSMKKKKKKKKK